MEKYSVSFKELNLDLLYQIMKLRIDVFVVEQECPYEELDGLDVFCQHFYYMDKGQVVAYLRVIPKEHQEENLVALGRVCVRKDYRKQGLAQKLLADALSYVENNMKESKILIGAQDYLRPFYEDFGFEAVSDVYLLDNIPHLDMIRTA